MAYFSLCRLNFATGMGNKNKRFLGFHSSRSGQNVEVKTAMTRQVMTTRPRALGLVRNVTQQFWRDEDGSILPFSLVIFILMLMFGGMAIDIMRHERARVLLQNTLDRAVLAAADMDQSQDPKAVVLEYFVAANLNDYIDPDDIIVDQGTGYKTVQATASATIPTFFMKMVDIDTLTAPASSSAQERIPNAEISLVFDISTSMNGARLNTLKAATNEFIEAVIPETEPVPASTTGITSLSIIPYHANVNIGSDLGQEFTFSNGHNYSQCAIFDTDDYKTTAVSTTQVLTRMAHFDRHTQQNNSPIIKPECSVSDDDAIIPHSVSRADLKAKVAALNVGIADLSAVDVSLKWGAALVDPAARPVINALENRGIIHSELRDRPADYSDTNTLKIIILLTDGGNTSQSDLKSEFKSGDSDIWVYTAPDGSKIYSAYIPETNQYYMPHLAGYSASPEGGVNAQRMSNTELFATFSVPFIADYFYSDSNVAQYNRYNNAAEEVTWLSLANVQTQDVCDAAHGNGIVIFTIAFEASTDGEQMMRNCASSASHYFEVAGSELTDVFEAIAATINKLKLTQ